MVGHNTQLNIKMADKYNIESTSLKNTNITNENSSIKINNKNKSSSLNEKCEIKNHMKQLNEIDNNKNTVVYNLNTQNIISNCGNESEHKVINENLNIVHKRPPPVPQKRKKAIGNFVTQNSVNASVINNNNNNNHNDNNNKHNSISVITSGLRNNGSAIKRQKIDASTETPPLIVPGIVRKPPLPPKPNKPPMPQLSVSSNSTNNNRTKKKQDESNAVLVQKLSANAEQLRLEVADLKTALNSEKVAVRSLRAQMEADARKVKAEAKKQHDAMQMKHKIGVASNDLVTLNTDTTNVNTTIKNTTTATTTTTTATITTTSTSGAFKRKAPKHDSLNDLTVQLDMQAKLHKEISVLKDTIRHLEEKVQISSDADRRKASDIRELKDSYELRLTQISKSAKIEMHRLLEEIKTKEKQIGQLRKEFSTYKKNNEKGSSQMMRKEKDVDRNVDNIKNLINENTNITNKGNITTNFIQDNNNLTTCGNENNSLPHEIATGRTIDSSNEINFINNKELSVSDNDSALSSAPPSLSPQPGTFPYSPDMWQTFMKRSKEMEHLQKDYESLQDENQFLNCELVSAKEQICELEKTLFMLQDCNKSNEYLATIKYLEQQNATLQKETHDLQEQNELLEFRIIELEESYDKWSFKIKTTSPLQTRDMWTDTEQIFDENTLLTDRSDSGVISPHGQHFMDISLPCDLSIVENNDDIRRKILTMSKKYQFDDDDKNLLLQIISLLNNLEALSQDSDILGEEFLNNNKHKSNLDCTNTIKSSSTVSSFSNSPLKSHERIVATVQPYTSGIIGEEKQLKSTNNSQYDSPKKARYLSTLSLQESGVFEGDPPEFSTQYTQTDPIDFPTIDKTNGDLCAEIQKLNKFRKKIEECCSNNNVGKTSTNCTTPKTPNNNSTNNGNIVVSLLSPNSSDQRRLQYYQERLELLEKKILIYESTGDVQVRRLAERLQREIQLEALVKQLSQKIDKLETENSRLEEEKCEFEEAENDTRLHLQRLEVDLEILTQRNVELEMSRDRSKAHAICLQDSIEKAQDRIYTLEDQENDYKVKLDLIKTFMPVILLYQSWKTEENLRKKLNNVICSNDNKPINVSNKSNNPVTCSPTQLNELPDTNVIVQQRLQELINREQELQQNISELNRAYNETLESADNLWAQMEKEYKDKIFEAKETQNLLKCKVQQLEERLRNDAQCAQERISQLEESETLLKGRIHKLTKDCKLSQIKFQTLFDEFQLLTEEYGKLKVYLEGPVTENLDRERRKVKEFHDEVESCHKMLNDLEKIHSDELNVQKNQLSQINNELIHISVSNGELKEEVITLENRIRELLVQKNIDDKIIKNLMVELKNKHGKPIRVIPQNLIEIDQQSNTKLLQSNYNQYSKTDLETDRSLAQELQSISTTNSSDINNLLKAVTKLNSCIKIMEECAKCTITNQQLKHVTNEIRRFATCLKNQEDTGYKQRTEYLVDHHTQNI